MTYIDHSCCFEEENPPCGQKIEHLKCCLCEKMNPKCKEYVKDTERLNIPPTENWEKRWKDITAPLYDDPDRVRLRIFEEKAARFIDDILSSHTSTILKEIEGAKKVGNIGTPGVNFNSGLDKASEIVRKIA